MPGRARPPNQAAHAEIQQRRPQQATDGGVERRGQATVGHQLRVGGGEAAGDAAGGAHETTEDHRRTWIVQADVGRDERRQDHHQDRLHQPGGDAQRHHLGAGPQGGAGHRSDDVGDRAGADGGQADRIGVAERHGHRDPGDERRTDSEEQRHHPGNPCPTQFLDIHPEGRGDDGEVAQHGAAQQADTGHQGHVHQSFLPAGGDAADVGQHQAEEDRDRRAVQAPAGEARRQPVGHRHGHADDGEAADQAVAIDDFVQGLEHGAHPCTLVRGFNGGAPSAFFRPKRSSSGTRAKATATAAMPARIAAGPPLSAPRTFCWAAMATTMGM